MEVKSYLRESLTMDLKAGFITGVVALPLAIAFAIASGVAPVMGLYTAVVAGFLGSLFGGSKFSITGPTGAMSIIILSTVSKFGVEGLLLAGFLAGLFQVVFGLMKLGRFVKFIPLPVVSGFTAGIGVIIFIGQLGNFFGVSIAAHEHVWETVIDVFNSLGGSNLTAILIGSLTFAALVLLPKLTGRIKLSWLPPSMIMLLLSTAAVFFMSLNVPVVGAIPSGLPSFSLIAFSFDLVQKVLPSALTIALLGSIEALLCAVVCDGMTSTKHDSDRELLSQGFANLVTPFFGGMASTAAIARSGVNIREGAKSRFSGVVHALVLLSFMLFFYPIAQFIPKSFLAGILMLVSLRMIDLKEFRTIMKISDSDTIVFLVTVGLTVFTDLVFAVQAGMFFAVFLIFVRLTKTFGVTSMEEYDDSDGINARVNASHVLRDSVAVYTLHGPFFFGALNVFDRKVNEHIHTKRPFIILRMKHVPFIDSTGVERLKSFIEERHAERSEVFLTTLQPKVREALGSDKSFKKLIGNRHVFERTQLALNFVEKKLKSSK